MPAGGHRRFRGRCPFLHRSLTEDKGGLKNTRIMRSGYFVFICEPLGGQASVAPCGVAAVSAYAKPKTLLRGLVLLRSFVATLTSSGFGWN